MSDNILGSHHTTKSQGQPTTKMLALRTALSLAYEHVAAPYSKTTTRATATTQTRRLPRRS